jgi:hypothetical protein
MMNVAQGANRSRELPFVSRNHFPEGLRHRVRFVSMRGKRGYSVKRTSKFSAYPFANAATDEHLQRVTQAALLSGREPPLQDDTEYRC